MWLLISLCAGGVRHLYYNNNLYTANSYFCVSQGSAEILFRRGGRLYNFLMRNFLGILYTKNYWNRSSFKVRVTRNINRGTFFRHTVLRHRRRLQRDCAPVPTIVGGFSKKELTPSRFKTHSQPASLPVPQTSYYTTCMLYGAINTIRPA